MATSKSKDPRVLDVNPRIGTCVGSATAAELPVVLELAASTGMVACIIGLPGVGKTAHINAWSEKRGSGKPVCVVASQMDPTDVTGLPFPSERNEYTNYLPPVWQQRVCDGNPHVLFFDEFSNTTRTVQAALLKVIGERRFANGAKIPDNVAVICAMNPESCAADYVPLAAPMANRLMFVSYKPTVKEVCAGMTGGWYSEEEYASFTEEERTWRKRVARFLTDNPQYMLDMNDEFASNVTDSAAAAYLDPESEKDESEREIMVYAWASPRSWENACKVLGRLPIDPKELTPLQSRIVSGIVGRKATLAFQKYVKEHGMLDTRAIIADPDSVSWIPNDEMTLNDIYELASAIASEINECTPDGANGTLSAEEAMEFFEKTAETDDDGNPVLPGAAAIFATFITGKGQCREHLSKTIAAGSTSGEWRRRITNCLVQYKSMDVISGTDRKIGKAS